MKKHLEVVAAILIHDGKILCMQRGEGKFAYVSKPKGLSGKTDSPFWCSVYFVASRSR